MEDRMEISNYSKFSENNKQKLNDGYYNNLRGINKCDTTKQSVSKSKIKRVGDILRRLKPSSRYKFTLSRKSKDKDKNKIKERKYTNLSNLSVSANSKKKDTNENKNVKNSTLNVTDFSKNGGVSEVEYETMENIYEDNIDIDSSVESDSTEYNSSGNYYDTVYSSDISNNLKSKSSSTSLDKDKNIPRKNSNLSEIKTPSKTFSLGRPNMTNNRGGLVNSKVFRLLPMTSINNEGNISKFIGVESKLLLETITFLIGKVDSLDNTIKELVDRRRINSNLKYKDKKHNPNIKSNVEKENLSSKSEPSLSKVNRGNLLHS